MYSNHVCGHIYQAMAVYQSLSSCCVFCICTRSAARPSPLLPFMLNQTLPPGFLTDLVHALSQDMEGFRIVIEPVLRGLASVMSGLSYDSEECIQPLTVLRDLCEIKVASVRPVCKLVSYGEHTKKIRAWTFCSYVITFTRLHLLLHYYYLGFIMNRLKYTPRYVQFKPQKYSVFKSGGNLRSLVGLAISRQQNMQQDILTNSHVLLLP